MLRFFRKNIPTEFTDYPNAFISDPTRLNYDKILKTVTVNVTPPDPWVYDSETITDLEKTNLYYASEQNQAQMIDILAQELQDSTVEKTNVTTIAEQITTDSYPCRTAIVIASIDNSDYIQVGTSELGAKSGIPLFTGDFIELKVSNVNKLYVKSHSATQKVTVLYYN